MSLRYAGRRPGRRPAPPRRARRPWTCRRWTSSVEDHATGAPASVAAHGRRPGHARRHPRHRTAARRRHPRGDRRHRHRPGTGAAVARSGRAAVAAAAADRSPAGRPPGRSCEAVVPARGMNGGMGIVSPGFSGRRRSMPGTELPPGQYLTEDFPVLSAGPTPRVPLDTWEFVITTETGQRAPLDRGPDLMALPARDADRRHPLRDQVVQARHQLAGRVRSRRCCRGRRHRRRLRAGPLVRRLHHQPAAGGPARRAGLDRVRVRRRAAARPSTAGRPGCSCRTCTSGSRPSGCAASQLLLERRARASGRPPATTTTVTRGASSGTRATERAGWRGGSRRWSRPATRRRPPAPWSSTCPAGPATCAGQHVDVRLTAEDGYRTQRSYSIAVGGRRRPGRADRAAGRRRRGVAVPDRRASRSATRSSCAARSAAGSSGGPTDTDPVLLVAGGSGIVPLMAMIRARRRGGQPGRRSG